MRVPLALALLLPAIAFAGCSKVVKTAKTETSIRDGVEKQLGADVKSVSCPDDVPAKKGDTFDCKVTGADGTSGDAVVTQTDAKAHLHFEAPFIHIRNLEQLLSKNIGEQVGANDVKVSCPEIVVGKKGDRFDCDAVSGKDKATVKVTQKDDRGNVNYKLQQQ